ncbi:MAG: Crp/Fnr family transcriptional regulator [Eubacterium sp.]
MKMEQYFESLKRCALFAGVKDSDLLAMMGCLGAIIRYYDKNELILKIDDSVSMVGILAKGKAQVIKEDIFGNRNIVAEIEGGDLFAESVVCAGMKKSPVTVAAVEKCDIIYVNLSKMVSVCGKECHFHTHLIENLLKIIARKNLALNRKLDYLSLRTTREKLIKYLAEEQKRMGSNPFSIPFNRSELADYLCVDRSAMSRELCKMRDEDIISFKKNEFKLKDF